MREILSKPGATTVCIFRRNCQQWYKESLGVSQMIPLMSGMALCLTPTFLQFCTGINEVSGSEAVEVQANEVVALKEFSQLSGEALSAGVYQKKWWQTPGCTQCHQAQLK